jgi:hypothetical protein
MNSKISLKLKKHSEKKIVAKFILAEAFLTFWIYFFLSPIKSEWSRKMTQDMYVQNMSKY